MRLLLRARTPLFALVCLAAAAALALVALDARAWPDRIKRDDLHFRALHSHLDLWRSPARVPGDPARVLLGIGEPLAYRQALQLFWYSRVGSDPQSRRDLPTIRVEAQNALDGITRDARSPQERSTAANLLGVLTVTTPVTDKDTQTQTLRRAAGYFKKAIAEDPANYAAKLNLELVLRLRRPGKSKFGHDARAGFGFGKGRGAGVVGGGY